MLYIVLFLHSSALEIFVEGGRCEEGEKCDDILDELENIDDELDESGMVFVTTEDTAFAKKQGIKSFPSLILFRNKEPIQYKGMKLIVLVE